MIEELLTGVTEYLENLDGIIREGAQSCEQEILQEQREQLFSGKASSGEDLRPYYSEDLQSSGGYFKNIDSARRYKQWKAELTYPSQTERANLDAPNLYINGKFHLELGMQFDEETMSVEGTTNYAQRIMDKYGWRNFGLMDERWATILDNYIQPYMVNELKNRL